MLRPHRHFKCCPLTFDCFWPGPKAPGIPTGGRWQHFVAHNAAKAELKKWNGKFNELAKVPSGTECVRSQLLFSSYIYIFFWFGLVVIFSSAGFVLSFGQNYFQQICQIKLHVQEAAIASLEGEAKFGCLRGLN